MEPNDYGVHLIKLLIGHCLVSKISSVLCSLWFSIVPGHEQRSANNQNISFCQVKKIFFYWSKTEEKRSASIHFQLATEIWKRVLWKQKTSLVVTVETPNSFLRSNERFTRNKQGIGLIFSLKKRINGDKRPQTAIYVDRRNLYTVAIKKKLHVLIDLLWEKGLISFFYDRHSSVGLDRLLLIESHPTIRSLTAVCFF